MFAMIAQNGDEEAVRYYLDRLGAQVKISESNYIEAIRAPGDERYKRCRVILTVAVGIEPYPGGYLDAQELLSEIRRCRADWINKKPNLRSVYQFLSHNKNFWRSLVNFSDPSFEFESDEQVKKLLYGGVGEIASTQKYNRKEFLGKSKVTHVSPDPDVNRILQSMEFIDQEWRLDSAGAWTRSLWGSNPIDGDYRDFLIPYLKMEVIKPEDFDLMWLECVEKHRVPRNYVQTRAHSLQMDYKITMGNAIDRQHALRMLECHWFFTTDKTFSKILESIESELRSWPRKNSRKIRPIASPIFVDRSNPDTVSAIKSSLNDR